MKTAECHAHDSDEIQIIVVSCSNLHEEKNQLERLQASSIAPPTSFISKTEACSSKQASAFDSDLYFAHLTSSSLGHTLLSTKQLPSTQDFVKDNIHVLGNQAVLVADKQTNGKGRGGNEWSSPDGCLMFTCARSVHVSGEMAPFLNYVVCLALIKGIRDVVGTNCGEIRIKWPNDIHVALTDSTGSLKLGGILINSSFTSSGCTVISGIGVNVFNHEPTICLDQIKERISTEGGTSDGSLSRERLLARIISRLEECYNIFQSSGFAPLEAEYLASWMHSGQRVKASNASYAGSSDVTVLERELTIVGVSPSGFLLAQDDYGSHFELSPDGNRLDMLKGLVSRRL